MLMPPRKLMRLMFKWDDGCLWCGNDAAREAFDAGCVEDGLSISDPTEKVQRSAT